MAALTEIELLERIAPELEAEGYEVFLQPNKPLIPQFLGDFVPDAIARRADKNLVIEVLMGPHRSSAKVDRLNALLRGHHDWELRLVSVDQRTPQPIPRVQDQATILEQISEVRAIAASGRTKPALLLAWATFEALARAALPDRFQRAQTPGRLVEVLASEGVLTPSEADFARALAVRRNELIHGELQVAVSADELARFVALLETVADQLPG